MIRALPLAVLLAALSAPAARAAEAPAAGAAGNGAKAAGAAGSTGAPPAASRPPVHPPRPQVVQTSIPPLAAGADAPGQERRVGPRLCPVAAAAALMRRAEAKTPDALGKLAEATAKLVQGQDPACVERIFLQLRAADAAALAAYTAAQAPEAWPYPLPPARRAKVQGELARAGWRLGESEGAYLFEADPAWMADRFAARLPEAWRVYFQQRAREVNEGFAEDDGLAISWAALAGRIGFWDHFLGRFPDFPEAASLRAANEDYVHTLLYGLDNTPVHDGKDVPHLCPEARQAYVGFIQTYPASPHATLLRAYLTYLEAHGGRFDDGARAFLDARLR